MKDIDKTRLLCKEINGWLTDREGEALYNLASSCTGAGVIVEVGSWKGKSTTWLARGSKRGSGVKVYAIDPHTGSSEHHAWYGLTWTFDEFKKNIKNADADNYVEPIITTSEEAARSFNRPVELLFIDGDHSFEAVALDFLLWLPKLIEGGTIAVHDTASYANGISWPGPSAVTKKMIYFSDDFKNVKIIDSMTIATKNSGALHFKEKFNKRMLWFLRNSKTAIYNIKWLLTKHDP